MAITGRTYEILGFLREDEKSVDGFTMVARAKEMDANSGQDDGQHLLEHQEEIPKSFRGEVVFVFPDWRSPDDHGDVAFVRWEGSRWVRDWCWLAFGFYGCGRVLRRNLDTKTLSSEKSLDTCPHCGKEIKVSILKP